MRPSNLWRWLTQRDGGSRERAVPQARTHVVLLDGTLSTLEPGHETSIGLIWKMLEAEAQDCLYYEPGLEWQGLRRAPELMAGVGINRQIRRAYAFLANRWRPGDRIFLIGYSRGAYAVRALAGMIDRVGLIRPEAVDEDRILQAYEHYRDDPLSTAARQFRQTHCHKQVEITAVAVLDTVQAVGIRWPVLWRLFPQVHAFRSHRLGKTVRHGFHAMALDETRKAYALERWRTHGSRTATVEQVWFRGSHGDLGGQLAGRMAARPLANIPATWLLERLQPLGLDLPAGWRAHFPTDPQAPSAGNWRGWGPVFLSRKRRAVALDPSESIHPSALPHRAAARLRTWDPPKQAAAE